MTDFILVEIQVMIMIIDVRQDAKVEVHITFIHTIVYNNNNNTKSSYNNYSNIRYEGKLVIIIIIVDCVTCRVVIINHILFQCINKPHDTPLRLH